MEKPSCVMSEILAKKRWKKCSRILLVVFGSDTEVEFMLSEVLFVLSRMILLMGRITSEHD